MYFQECFLEATIIKVSSLLLKLFWMTFWTKLCKNSKEDLLKWQLVCSHWIILKYLDRAPIWILCQYWKLKWSHSSRIIVIRLMKSWIWMIWRRMTVFTWFNKLRAICKKEMSGTIQAILSILKMNPPDWKYHNLPKNSQRTSLLKSSILAPKTTAQI